MKLKINQYESIQSRLIIKLLFIFFLLNCAYGFVYFYLGVFPGHGVEMHGIQASFFENFYFSIVTITTLGYGDFSPVGWSRIVSSSEVIIGLIFVGYSITQVLSVKQDAFIEYLASDRIHQTYNECIEMIVDSKGLIADRRRMIQHKEDINPVDFVYDRSNPFYPALKAMQKLNGYTAHLEDIGKIKELERNVEKAAHHVEELAGFSRKYINLLKFKKIHWSTHRTVKILNEICDAVDFFSDRFVTQTKYNRERYKDGTYSNIVVNITTNIRHNIIQSKGISDK